MIDWSKVSGFDWDAGNAGKNDEKHNVSQSEAEQIFLDNPLVVAEDWKHSRIEVRYHALGKTVAGRHLHVAFTLRSNATLIRVISARDMHRKERAIHEQAKENTEV